MSAMDALLERSRSPGTFVERRRFSLARDKAIEKMKEFSLRDPRQCRMGFIQGAVFAEATYIAVDTHRDRIVVGWVGRAVPTAAKSSETSSTTCLPTSPTASTHVVQLAIALNALLQRKPKVLRVESGDGTSAGTVRLDLDPSGKGTVGVPEAGLAGTYILAEFGGGSWFDRFKGRTVTPEQELVETRCRYTPVRSCSMAPPPSDTGPPAASWHRRRRRTSTTGARRELPSICPKTRPQHRGGWGHHHRLRDPRALAAASARCDLRRHPAQDGRPV